MANDETPNRRRRQRKVLLNLFGRDKVAEGDWVEQSMKGYQSQRIEDPFASEYSVTSGVSATSIIQPSYNPSQLHKLPNENSVLRQCIDAYVVNIEGHGHRFEYVGEEGQEDSAAARLELQHLESLAETPNEEYGLTELRTRLRRDYETYGYWNMEIARDVSGNTRMMYHVPAHTVRMTQLDPEPVEVDMVVYRNGQYVRQKVSKRFRRYVQMAGSKKVYFKQFGDPRPISAKTGRVEEGLDITEEATEILHQNQYAPDETYGLPRWISQLPSILGMRESELNNLQFFKDNAIPAMAVLISGGLLTDEAVENLEHQFTNNRGRDAMNRVLVLEATGDSEMSAEDGKVPAPRLEIKPLTDERQKDGMFQEYEDNCQRKIRSAFRLPPLFIGTTEDMTHATAKSSLSVTEGQVFGPERVASDEVFNKHIFTINGEPPKFWRIRSNPPRLVNPEDVMAALKQFDELGAMTPNVAIGLANEMFDLDVPEVVEAWGNFPFVMVTAMLEKGEIDFETGAITSVDGGEQEPNEGDVLSDPVEEGSEATKAVTAPAVDDQGTFVRQSLSENTQVKTVRGRVRTRRRKSDVG